MKEQFTNLMIEAKVMPIEEPVWRCFDIEHRVMPCTDLDQIRKYINHHLQNANGIYAYKDGWATFCTLVKERLLKTEYTVISLERINKYLETVQGSGIDFSTSIQVP